MPIVAQPQTSAHISVAPRGARRAVVPYSWDLMLLDSAAERLDLARAAMESGQNHEKHRLMSAAVQIVGELRSTLDVRGDDPLAAHMSDLCDYMCRQLVDANLQNRVATLDEASHLLRETRIAWVLLPPEARTPTVTGE
jgi:flagellar protein FliS